jgi:hypothetical protein
MLRLMTKKRPAPDSVVAAVNGSVRLLADNLGHYTTVLRALERTPAATRRV